MMLFFGAGASKPVGIPTMKEMSRMFENSIDLGEEERELYLDIKNSLDSDNLEDILTVLNDLINNYVPVRYITSYIKKLFDLAHLESLTDLLTGGDSEFHNNLREIYEHLTLIEKEKLEALKSKILTFIRENCVLKEESRKDALKTYNQLFETLRYPIFHEIFTTNYDLVVDKYIESTKQPYHDGFNNGLWDPKGYEQNIEFKILKLHGAIDQYVTEKGRIVKVGVLGATRTVDGEELKEAIIYPMREKEVYKDPFFELFTRLKTSLLSEEICIIIGYSFGDEHIRNIFFDAVKRNPEIRIFMINTNAQKIRDDLEPIKDNIEPIEGKFGEERVFEELNKKLSEV
ncbi:MAG: SIR2 family protein [Methanophagales archaeon]|nr:SIR2 family protein [Methanophagales archaeon]